MLYKENERRFFHRTAKMADLDNIPEDPRFTEQVNRVEGTYPDNGNRGQKLFLQNSHHAQWFLYVRMDMLLL